MHTNFVLYKFTKWSHDVSVSVLFRWVVNSDAAPVHRGASWSAVDQVAKCEEAVALRREADVGQHGLEGQILAVHVSDGELARLPRAP